MRDRHGPSKAVYHAGLWDRIYKFYKVCLYRSSGIYTAR